MLTNKQSDYTGTVYRQYCPECGTTGSDCGLCFGKGVVAMVPLKALDTLARELLTARAALDEAGVELAGMRASQPNASLADLVNGALKDTTLICRRIARMARTGKITKLPAICHLADHGVRLGMEAGVQFSPLREEDGE